MKNMMKKRWFIFCDDQLVVKKTGETEYSIPEYDDTPCPLSGDDIMIDVADISGEGTVMAAMTVPSPDMSLTYPARGLSWPPW